MTANSENYIDHFDHLDQISQHSGQFATSRIHGAICDADSSLLYMAVSELDNLALIDEHTGFTYMHLVVSRANPLNQQASVAMIHILSNGGTPLTANSLTGLTPLQIAIQRNLVTVVVALLRCGGGETGGKGNLVNSLNPKQKLPSYMALVLSAFQPGLWSAVKQKDYMTVSRLISFWCRIRVQSEVKGMEGITLISFARQINAGSLIIELLENNRTTLEFVHSTLAGDEQRMLDLLQNKNIDIYILDHSPFPDNQQIANDNDTTSDRAPSLATVGRSLRWTARYLGHNHLVHLLPEKHTRPCVVSTGSVLVRPHPSQSGFRSEEDNGEIESKTDPSMINYLAVSGLQDKDSRCCSPAGNEHLKTSSSVCALL